MMHAYITVVGSKLYGTNTDQSDTDFKGFGMAEVDQIIGMSRLEQQEYTNHLNDGPQKIEGVIYDVKRLLHLLYKGNPTVLEPCCADNSFYVLDTKLGRHIRSFVQNTFLTKHLFKPYSAYHRAQMRKLQSMDRIGKRAELVKEHGYDPKFAGHAYRLAKQCVEIMKYGVLTPTLQGDVLRMCKDIRQAVYTKEQTLEILNDVDKEMYEAYSVSILAEKPDYNKINQFVIDLYAQYIHWRHHGEDVSKEQLFSDLVDAQKNCEILKLVTEKLVKDEEVSDTTQK